MARSWKDNASLITVDAMIAAILYQFYQAGVGIIGGGSLEPHRGFGYALYLLGLVAILVMWVTRPPPPVRWYVFGAFMLITTQPALIY